jgi:hypothetical protein
MIRLMLMAGTLTMHTLMRHQSVPLVPFWPSSSRHATALSRQCRFQSSNMLMIVRIRVNMTCSHHIPSHHPRRDPVG